MGWEERADAISDGNSGQTAEPIRSTEKSTLPATVSVETTKLDEPTEKSYQSWKNTLPKNLQYEGDYDLRGFYKKNPKFAVDDPEQHMTDEFKLPNHKTFSNESKYYNEKTKHLGGHWDGDVFVPNDTNFKQIVDESVPSWEKRADAIPKVGLSGPGSKDTDPIELAPNQHIPELSDIPKGFVAGVNGMADTAVRANRQASDVIQHPIKTLGNEQFRTEAMRGVNDTIAPFIGNRAVEAIGGPPRESASDKAAFPDANALGSIAGMAVPIPIGETVGAIKSGLGKAGAAATERIIGREQARVALRDAASDAESRAFDKMAQSKTLREGSPEYLASRREVSDLMSEASKKRRELAKMTRAPSVPEILGHAALGAVTHGISVPYTAYKLGKNAPQLADSALSKLGGLSEKIPDIGATYNPISAINKTTRGIVDRMAEIEAKHPRDYQMGAITLDRELSKLPPDFIKNRKDLDEAKRLARYALDKSLSDEERNKAIRESLDLIKDFGNE